MRPDELGEPGHQLFCQLRRAFLNPQKPFSEEHPLLEFGRVRERVLHSWQMTEVLLFTCPLLFQKLSAFTLSGCPLFCSRCPLCPWKKPLSSAIFRGEGCS